MFTQDFRKPFLALSAILTAAMLYFAVVLLMQTFSAWTERELHAFPFKQEDWLRYLLPSYFELTDQEKIMLVGPSLVRENFRYERFEAAFPDYDIYQGGIGAGTLEDVTAALEYVEKVYGNSALPTVLVLGISPRVVANFPENPEDRAFAMGLNRYSPYYSTKQESSRLALQPKPALEGALARARFVVLKEPWRFRTSLMALGYYLLSKDTFAIGDEPTLAKGIDRLLKFPVIARVIDALGYSRASNFTFLEILQWMISPYKYSLNPPLQYRVITREEFKRTDTEPDSVWSRLYDWDPRKTENVVRERLKNFADFIKRHGMRTLVINLPERDFSRALFLENNYQAYLRIVNEELKGMEIIDLKNFLDAGNFYDREHTTPAGSAKLSDEVIRLMRAGILHQRQLQVEQGE